MGTQRKTAMQHKLKLESFGGNAPLVVDLAAEKITTVIGKGTVQQSSITTNEGILVLGSIVGNVTSASGTVFIAETSEVQGLVTGERVIVAGKVVGNVQGGNVLLGHTAHVYGDIQYQNLSLEPDAQVEGRLSKIR